ncbi:recombinase RecT [Campylobacter concisus]|uniref:Recombinational DNA repair protein RecT (Prophage associated) n=1 Tax=Campylobacter concisus ATCC 51562 TaxID=1242969 RepID=U2EPD6_9BACT|nr:recombinase RecT [Campylobacter concisus]ERJ25906.1 Recombinational DNA repair protein RecT (prophage associated) [Campylobacter concisus ATCC 51562]
MNQIQPREQQARALVGSKMNQIQTIVGNDKAKASIFASAIANMANDYGLRNCSVESIVNTAMQIVQIGLNPNKLFGQAYVVPFKLKNGGETAQLQIGYKGLISLGMKNGWKFRAVAVYKCDEFKIEFNGLEDKINFTPNFDERSDDDGDWVFSHLVGVIVYAKDSNDNVFSEFVSKKKLEKLRLKSQNQSKKDKLEYIWLDWAEEMYKAKALKYVASRLPINDRLAEAVSAEDEPITKQETITPPKTGLNELLGSAEKPSKPTINQELTIQEAEVLDNAMPHDLLQSELVKRGASETEAEKLVERLSIDDATAYLNDPSSIDNLIENLKDN